MRSFLNDIARHADTLRQVVRLPRASLRFDARLAPDDIPAVYRQFTRPHPRYRIIGNKTVGAALLDLGRFDGPAAYLAAIAGKNRGAWHARRARARGYVCRPIERNEHVDAIHAINTALDTRQGRPMDDHYRRKATRFETQPHYEYYGVLDGGGRLVAYANIARYGDFSAFSQLIGLRNNDGIMHLLVVDIVVRLLERGEVRYLMYDTFFGAQPGLQHFKRILGFEPYHVKYSLQ
ncbi:hypothetical protein [uncultured Massilia sp.]|uniref:hypothetical protein n=1 Tax=uncultured Massilia sp. TaxID=169973 RepID=UPI0025FD09EB|nr:hypothetical protein [uncultured Massilia sp.]